MAFSKRNKIIGTAAALVVLCSSFGYVLGKYQAEHTDNNTISYVIDKGKNKTQKTTLAADKSPDDISRKEGISKEL
ncbi:pneumococcal-type histidine triad protein [Streptococcus dysgalactiae]|uniref:pneumococcal-type histidine triad protein n=1 Tax=Streptococcus dysgalactiae TaxID=1334 RepID=UPI000E02F937|nr:pneumococcal-type histidine triad protein [Streptococcus dysgalactiae]MEE3743644.1 pneumococcal-type histidine triad protein [Streptococcus dysgalactiae]QQT04238.1 pneumococcal-type histidine triad protein [Streptococcus dysgalactiae]SUN45598.1 histidine triad protein [Streptococcus dysgalactiae subsp. dysgalactiae]SUN50292.1 histidine triad protein [Streptococcus dysgalactiae]SUN55323.1 histidine triad protein [Streptococcus dysgalactiae]